MNIIRNSSDSVPFHAVSWDEDLSNEIIKLLGNGESIELFKDSALTVSLRGCQFLSDFYKVAISDYIPIPYELGIEFYFAITPINIYTTLEFNGPLVDRDLKFFSRYYYEVIGFVRSELMFFYGLE
jgi:hypothetical protein